MLQKICLKLVECQCYLKLYWTRIVENELKKVNGRMKQKGHTLEVGQDVIDWLIEKSFHADLGARPLKRGIV